MTRRPTPRVAIFTLTYNRLEYTARMFETLENASSLPFDHYVVDNGSQDGTPDYLRSKPGRLVATVLNDENLGISLAANQALDLIGNDYDYIIKMDNDCESVTPGWMDSVIEVCEAGGRRFVGSPYIDGLEGGTHPGGYPRTGRTEMAGHRIGLTNHLGGICVVAPAEAYREFRFPTRIPLHGGADVRFSMYVRMSLGYEMGYVEDVVVRSMDGFEQYAKYKEYFEARGSERLTVPGESAMKTRLARPFRRMLLVHQMNKAGLSERTVAAAAMSKAKRICAACSLETLKGIWKKGGDEWI